MARTRSISDESILDAAREVFLDKGYSATTAEIARRAGISEGTIFRRFPNKQALFVSALGTSDVPAWVELARSLAATDADRAPDPIDRELTQLLHAMYEFFADMVPRMIGAMASPVCVKRIIHAHDEPMPVRGHRALARYLEARGAAGRLALRATPMVVARTMIGTIHSHAFFEQMALNDVIGLDLNDVVAGLVAFVTHPPSPEVQGE